MILTPEDPKKGENLTASVIGNLSRVSIWVTITKKIVDRDVQDGILDITIYYRGFRARHLQLPLCETVKDGCPIKKGPMTTETQTELPKNAPSGRYSVRRCFSPTYHFLD